MSATAPALLAAAAGVGFGHAVLPDHWMPLAVLARAQRYRLARVTRLAALAGAAHVGFSLLLGAVIVAVGLQFRAVVQSRADLIVGLLLILTGAAFLLRELAGRGHGHSHAGHHHDHAHGHPHDHSHPHDHDHEPVAVAVATRERPDAARWLAVVVPFGAAASPDLTILPVFLAAGALGVGAAVGTLLVFAAVTLATIVGLTLLGAVLGYQLRGRWVDRGANSVTAAVLLLIGALVAAGVI